jgi:hypothetical protein
MNQSTDQFPDSITRRDFMKKTALTAGAVTLLGRGIGLAQTEGTSGASGCPNKPLFRFFEKTIWLGAGVARGAKPTPTITGPTDAAPDTASADCGFDALLKTGGTNSTECRSTKSVDKSPDVMPVERTLANGNKEYGWRLSVTASWIYQ